jgi:shikimate kinase
VRELFRSTAFFILCAFLAVLLLCGGVGRRPGWVMNIVLIGYRGCGKTTLGRQLAADLGRRFVDTDVRIVERAGKTIAAIFAEAGEAGFRDLESAVIAEVAGGDDQVIAAGGGAVLRPENVRLFRRGGKIVWLRATPEALYQRISADAATAANRPNLTAAGGLEEVRTLLARRSPLYEAAADATLDVTGLSPGEALAALHALLGLKA